ncbi:MAG: Gfo/Idh/MocA family oxidoreductase [Ruminococcaceae bacterium]|nr:Gfo/Idh/MocA family oxidoreductase [Oscillospiraceae bacterium]
MNASDIIRVGIIGCGGIANGKHMPSLSRVPGVEMVAFCDIIEERALQAKKDFGTEDAKTYTDYKELLEDKTIDVVHVCTPNRAHSFITVDALEAGKHVMCEKPMAINSVEAKKMLDASKRTGKMLTIGYQTRQSAQAQYLKAEAEAGTFGDIYFARACAVRRRAVPTWGVFLNEYEQGGGPLIDIGTHALDVTLWLMDNYKPKYCVGTAYHALNKCTEQGNAWGNWDPDKFTVEDSAFGFIVMENGATVSLDAAWALNTLEVREACCMICGTKAGADMFGGVHINGIRQNRQYTFEPNFNSGGAAFYEGVDDNSPQDKEAYQWIKAVREQKNPTVLPEQAYCITQILEGIYTSAKTGDIYRF